ncbi:MAG: right-handed parallel beta-helix repeat-containing protein [Candidatus Cloacimonetes bacterium]|nr:right-handed parallel beta-helix repeat-containing protein [Candidatus Cloacimonadota bacterium]
MKRNYLYILIVLNLVLLIISCGKKTTEIESDNYGVILDSLFYSTIQEAINEAVNGDTIFLTEGIYADAGDKNLNWNGNEKHLTIKLHEEANYAIIECNGKGSGFIFDRTYQDTADIIDGITIRNCGRIYDTAIYCENTAPTIKNCTISNCDWCGIYCHNAAPIIENNTISENKAGIMCDNGAIPLIRWNIIRDNRLESIYSSDEHTKPSIINNLIVNNKRGIHCLDGASTYMVNNTVADNDEYGIKVVGDTLTNVINSIVWGNGKGFEPENINITVSYSCAQDSIASVNPDSLGNIYDDPLFVFPGEDYHLLSISLCIDAGDNDAVNWDVDLDDEQRINNDVVDMGAYEW